MSSEIKFSPSSPDLRKYLGYKSDKFKKLRQVAESYTENGSFLTSFRCKTATTQILRSNISRASQYMTKNPKICVTTIWRAANFSVQDKETPQKHFIQSN